MTEHFVLKDPSQLWYEKVLAEHLDEAEERVTALLADTVRDENGCMVTKTTNPQRVRFQGGSDRVYRFVLAVLEKHAPSSSQFVRHRCHNRLCVNPDHLVFGSQQDNWRDEIERRSNGVDYRLL